LGGIFFFLGALA
jgi:hypothetical protein